jgi:tetrahydromethanopterin S-methyltransferase subunit E
VAIGVTEAVGEAVGEAVAVAVAVPVAVGVAVAVSVGVAVAVSVGVAVAVSVGVAVAVSVGVAVGAAQAKVPTWFVSIVTAPLRARVLPDTLAPVVRVMLVRARMLPTNTVPVPMVAELPTCQNTLQPTPLLVTRIDELLAVVSVLPI